RDACDRPRDDALGRRGRLGGRRLLCRSGLRRGRLCGRGLLGRRPCRGRLLLRVFGLRHYAFFTITTPLRGPGTAPDRMRSERSPSARRTSRFFTVTRSTPWCDAMRSPLSTRPGVVPAPTEPWRRRWSEPCDFGPRVKWCRWTGPWKPFPLDTPLTCTLSPGVNRSTPISCPVAN